MHHHAFTHVRFCLWYARPDSRDHATRLMAGNHRVRVLRKAGSLARLSLRPAILVQIAPAHAGRLHLHDHFVRARRWVTELHQIQLATAREYNTTHSSLLFAGCPDSSAGSPAWGTAGETRCAHVAAKPAARQNARMS